MGFTTNNFTITFFADGTFTSVGPTNAGTWSIAPPNRVLAANPTCHLTFTDNQGVVMFSADFIMLRVDQLVALQPWVSNLGIPISGVLQKVAP
jgi:hypothetical protein